MSDWLMTKYDAMIHRNGNKRHGILASTIVKSENLSELKIQSSST